MSDFDADPNKRTPMTTMPPEQLKCPACKNPLREQGAGGSPATQFMKALKLRLLLLPLLFAGAARASENVPHRPFAYWAELPDKGQFVVGAVYEESEAYHMWAAGQYHNVDWHAGGEHYGIDVNQGYLALQYGLSERWALDLNVGYVSTGWRYFDNGKIQSTSGLMDFAFGARYQLYNEATHLQTLSGSDIIYPVDPAGNGGYNMIYPRDPRENYDALEGGFSYTTSPRRWRYGFHLTSLLDGNNTDAKLWLGGSLDSPLGSRAKP